MALLVNLLLAATLAIPATPPASAPKPVIPLQVFTPYLSIVGQYLLSIDVAGAKVFAEAGLPLVLMDIEILLEKPIKYVDSPTLVKSYQNTVALDCVNDRILVVVGRAFDTRKRLVYTTAEAQIIDNLHDKLSPTSQLLNLVCPTPERERNTPPAGVTTRAPMTT